MLTMNPHITNWIPIAVPPLGAMFGVALQEIIEHNFSETYMLYLVYTSQRVIKLRAPVNANMSDYEMTRRQILRWSSTCDVPGLESGFAA